MVVPLCLLFPLMAVIDAGTVRTSSTFSAGSPQTVDDHNAIGGSCRDRYGALDDPTDFRRRSCSYCYWFLFPGLAAVYTARPPDPFLYKNVLLAYFGRGPGSAPKRGPAITESRSEPFDDDSLALNASVSFGEMNNALNLGHQSSTPKDALPITRLDPVDPADFDKVCQSMSATDCWRWKTCCSEAVTCCGRMVDDGFRRRHRDRFTDHSVPTTTPKTLTAAEFQTTSSINWALSDGTEYKNDGYIDDGADRDVQRCEMTWDGFGCWPATPSGTTESLTCPAFLPHSQQFRRALKHCTLNGTWYEKDGLPWTDYTRCLDISSYKVNVFIAVGFNVLCLIVLVPAILVFCAFRDLRHQLRVRVHVHFFLSLTLSSSVSLAWNVLVDYELLTNPVSTETVIARNEIWCRLLSVMKIYMTSCTYFWMLSEGCYLHRLLSRVFEQPESLIGFYLLGWVAPAITVGIYSAVRLVINSDSCWAINIGELEWIIYAPNLLCLTVNLMFLCNILRILMFQLHAHPSEPNNFRRGLKAGIMLVPLFGLQLLLTIYRPDVNVLGQKHYEYVTLAVTNSQGVFVALIFCFFNSEVMAHFCRRQAWPFSSCCVRRRTSRLFSTSQMHTTTHASVHGINDDATFSMITKNPRFDRQQRRSETTWSLVQPLTVRTSTTERYSVVETLAENLERDDRDPPSSIAVVESSLPVTLSDSTVAVECRDPDDGQPES